MANTKRERLKRQPSSKAAATRMRTSGTNLEKMRFIGPVTVRIEFDRSTRDVDTLECVGVAGDIQRPAAVSSRGLGRSPLKAQTRVRIPLPLFSAPIV